MEKLEWLGYPMVKNFEDIFIRFGTIHERDGRTDAQTPHADIVRAYASHRAAKTKINKLTGQNPEISRYIQSFFALFSFCHAMLCISAAYAVMRCLSVCVSVCCHVRGLCENK